MFCVKALAWCQWVPGFGKRVSLCRSLQTKFWFGILLGLKCSSDIFGNSIFDPTWPAITAQTLSSGKVAIILMRSTGANSWCLLSFQVHSFNMGKRVFPFVVPFRWIFLWYNEFNLNYSSSIVYVVPLCVHVNRADFRWNANVQDKLGLQWMDDYPWGIYRITAFRVPSNCILYVLTIL